MGKAAKIIQNQKNEFLQELDSLTVPKNKNGLNYVSVFCGGGGLDLGFSSAGFTPLYSSDVEPTCCETVSKNLPGHIVEPHDICELNGKEIIKRLSQDVDLVIGGPPCQSFSILGSRGATCDPRGQLVFEYVRFIKEVNPQAFLFENVPGILSVNKGKDWKELLSYFEEETGFFIKWTILNSAWFGAPQIRQRVIAVGFKNKNQYDSFEWPRKVFSESTEQSDIFSKSPRASHLALENVENLPNHVLRQHGERVINRYKTVLPGQRDKVDRTDRIDASKPSGTVLVGSGGGGGRPFIHPTEHRHITCREAARLQTFPDWWFFKGGPTASYRQVGNAVPPFMAKAIALQISTALNKK